MNLYKISQDDNDGYDTYDSAVVAAESEEAARSITPDGRPVKPRIPGEGYIETWATPDLVKVELIGTAKPGTKAGVICASFNAG